MGDEDISPAPSFAEYTRLPTTRAGRDDNGKPNDIQTMNTKQRIANVMSKVDQSSLDRCLTVPPR